ncbi:MAG: S9 family peptidase [Terriglobia bacterium]
MKRAASLLLGFTILSLLSLCVGPNGRSLNGSPQGASAARPYNAQSGKKLLTLQEVVRSDSIVAPGISALRWRPGGKQVTFVRPASLGKGGLPAEAGVSTLCAYDLEHHTETVLFNPSDRKEKVDLKTYQWSPRGDAILLEGDNDLWLLDPQTGGLRRLTQDADAEEVPAFSPGGDRIAFVKKHDLYALDLESGAARRLTRDGSDTIYNGRLDWVYEEELANRSTARAYEWSPDGKRLAYLRLDDGPVPEYPITEYLATHVSLIHERFPQAGDPNPRASLHVVAWEHAAAEPASLTLDSKQVEYLGPSFTWTPDATALCFLAINRAQSQVAVHRWDPGSGKDRVLCVEQDPYWVNSLEPPHFLKDGREFLWVSERDGWQHLYLYAAEGKLLRQITRGAWMIDRPIFQEAPLFQLDPQENWLYFAATNPDPRERQLFRVHLDGSGLERITTEPGSHALDLSPDGRFLADTFSAADTPPVTRLLHPAGTLAATLDSPANHLADYALGKREFLEVKARDGATLYAELLKPADFDPTRKYPVIVDVYGGPHIQLVQRHWENSSLFDQLLAQNGFLVWTLDNRGSWGRGHAWESVIFKDMGRHELEDQLAGVEYLKSLPYVDGGRIGIRGWSYGGYMTLYALTHAPEVFKCGAAGAPVTAWKFYDSIYTERYMRTPSENPEGYKNGSPLEAAANLRARLLIIHGTSDDNVHMQNTINFLDGLIRAGKPYELHLQPGQKHGFQGDVPRTYVDQRILDFFKQNL